MAGYPLAKHGLEQFQFHNIVSCLLRWVVSTIERGKSDKRAVLYPSIIVMPLEHSSGEFPLLFWLVLPFVKLIWFSRSILDSLEISPNGLRALRSFKSLSPGWYGTSCLFDSPTNKSKSRDIVLYLHWFHWKAQPGMIYFNGLLSSWSFTDIAKEGSFGSCAVCKRIASLWSSIS